jgi:hypothetical protein
MRSCSAKLMVKLLWKNKPLNDADAQRGTDHNAYQGYHNDRN